MKISLLQMDVSIGNPNYNFQNAKYMMEKSLLQQPELIVLPEMWNTGYDLTRAKEIADLDGERTRTLFSEFSKENNVHIVAGSILYHDSKSGNITNTMLVFDNQGNEILKYDKMHLFRLMDEDQYLTAGNTFGTFDFKETKVGVMICYDLRFPQLSRKLVQSGAKMLINVAQWPTPRVDHWKTLIQARAIENQSYFVAVNRCGTSRETNFPGTSMVIDPWGKNLLTGDSHADIYHVDIDLKEVDEIRSHIPVFEDQRLDLY